MSELLRFDGVDIGNGKTIVQQLSLCLNEGERLGLVGESGSGKTLSALSIAGLLPGNLRISSGQITIHLPDSPIRFPDASKSDIQHLRRHALGFVFQEPMSALNPVKSCGWQLAENIQMTRKLRKAELKKEVLHWMNEVELPNPERIYHAFPHQLSGGQRQRLMIAMALCNHPKLLIADEPTTALDVIVQDQILRKMRQLQRDRGDSMIYVSHDISVIAETCDQVGVMYAGEIVESADVDSFFYDAHHPYTMGLQNAFPQIHETPAELISIPGHPPDLLDPPQGCRFAQRCPFVQDICLEKRPALSQVKPGHSAACHFIDEAPQFREIAQQPETWRVVAERQYRERAQMIGHS